MSRNEPTAPDSMQQMNSAASDPDQTGDLNSTGLLMSAGNADGESLRKTGDMSSDVEANCPPPVLNGPPPVPTGLSDNELAELTGVLNPANDEMLQTASLQSAGPPATSNADTAGTLTEIGGYQFVRKLGEGAMGAVFLGRRESDPDGDMVAIKLLNTGGAGGLAEADRFRKEARMLQESRHENVTNVLDIGEENGVCYLVMEFVNGTDLQHVLKARPQLSESMALQMIAGVSSALAGAHARGIVHRDIKPANILICSGSQEGDGKAEVLRLIEAEETPVAKLSDFGLARHVDQSASMALTKTGAMLGTPYYISPEQCTDRAEISPATDIYSLGVTFFEMLAGRPPFHASDPIKLISMHCFEAAPDLRKLNPLVSDRTCDLISRMLEKNPANRFADGGHLLSELQKLIRGDSVEVIAHPAPPETHSEIREACWEWELDSDPATLWPLVTSTDRINQALGLPNATYGYEQREDGSRVRVGSFKLGPFRLKWDEKPHEWIEGQKLGILREFHGGPFKWFLSEIEVESRKGRGTLLRHRVRIATRNLLGRLFAWVEVSLKGKKGLDRVYRRIDHVASGKLTGSSIIDPFAPPPKLTTKTQERILQLTGRIPSDDLPPEAIQALVTHLTESPSQELARLRPKTLAHCHQLSETDMLKTCLRAAQVGLLDLHWDIICPTCRVGAQVMDTIKNIKDHESCEACDASFSVDVGGNVEMIFRVNPDVREADLNTYCVGGPEHAPHVVAQLSLQPGELLEVDLALDAGGYVLRGPQLPYTVPLSIESTNSSLHSNVTLGATAPAAVSPLAAGRQIIAIENGFTHPVQLRLERSVRRTDVVTAREASSIAEFRELFPEEIVSSEQLSDVATCTVLALRIANADDLYERLGDSIAVQTMRKRLADLVSRVATVGGTVSSQQEDRFIATFTDTASPLEFACDVIFTMHPEDSGSSEVLWRAAINRGTAMASTMNGQTGFFGRTLSVASSMIERESDASIVMPMELVEDPDVIAIANARQCTLCESASKVAGKPLAEMNAMNNKDKL